MKNFIFGLIALFFLDSCDFELTKGAPPVYHTTSIDSSIYRNIFSHKYKPINVKINDTINFNIKEVWCELGYLETDLDKNGKYVKNVKAKRHYNIVMILQENLQEKYAGLEDTWHFANITFSRRNNINRLYSYSGNLISFSPLPDTLEIKLEYYTPPDNPNEFWKTKQLGSFFLYKE